MAHWRKLKLFVIPLGRNSRQPGCTRCLAMILPSSNLLEEQAGLSGYVVWPVLRWSLRTYAGCAISLVAFRPGFEVM